MVNGLGKIEEILVRDRKIVTLRARLKDKSNELALAQNEVSKLRWEVETRAKNSAKKAPIQRPCKKVTPPGSENFAKVLEENEFLGKVILKLKLEIEELKRQNTAITQRKAARQISAKENARLKKENEDLRRAMLDLHQKFKVYQTQDRRGDLELKRAKHMESTLNDQLKQYEKRVQELESREQELLEVYSDPRSNKAEEQRQIEISRNHNLILSKCSLLETNHKYVAKIGSLFKENETLRLEVNSLKAEQSKSQLELWILNAKNKALELQKNKDSGKRRKNRHQITEKARHWVNELLKDLNQRLDEKEWKLQRAISERSFFCNKLKESLVRLKAVTQRHIVRY